MPYPKNPASLPGESCFKSRSLLPQFPANPVWNPGDFIFNMNLTAHESPSLRRATHHTPAPALLRCVHCSIVRICSRALILDLVTSFSWCVLFCSAVRFLSVALHKFEAADPGLVRGSSLQRAPRDAPGEAAL